MAKKEEISDKNTKAQILEAYHAALDQLKKTKTEDPQVQQKQAEQRSFVDKVPNPPKDQLEDHLYQVKQSLNQKLASLTELLLKENQTFLEVKQAIDLEKESLRSLYDIKAKAQSLSALMIAQEQEKTTFLEEKKKRQIQWEQDQKEWASKRSQEEADLKKARQREEEEYNYQLTLSRRQDLASFEEKKKTLLQEAQEKKEKLTLWEKDLKEREAKVKALETEVASFPKELEKACKEAQDQTFKKVDSQYKAQMALREKEIEGAENLLKLQVASLEQKIKDQDKTIQYLREKSDSAVRQVQDIACKAIDSTSDRGKVPPSPSIHQEMQKNA